jgi:hypothetical protein
VIASGVSLLPAIYLLLLHWVKTADDLAVVVVVNAVVAVLKKLLLGHLVPVLNVPNAVENAFPLLLPLDMLDVRAAAVLPDMMLLMKICPLLEGFLQFKLGTPFWLM